MAKTLHVVGLVWMVACAVLWLYFGLIVPEPFDPDRFGGFTLPRLLAESRYGLTILPLLLAIPGAWLWRRYGRPAD